jgi:aryl-alcohol dehydrogenase-like predicted oxidoreductase
MAWSPLASGLLSGKYRPSSQGETAGRLETVRGTTNPGFQKFNERNWAIVAELEKVAGELGRSMAQVAVNWAMTQPGIASIIVGATKLEQLKDNLGALEFTIPHELRRRLDDVSVLPSTFPYSFFGPEIQGSLTGGQTVGGKPVGYYPDLNISGKFAGVS